MEFYINELGNPESEKKFDSMDEMIAALTQAVENARTLGEPAFQVVWSSGEVAE